MDKDDLIRKLTEDLAKVTSERDKSREAHRWALQQITRRTADVDRSRVELHEMIRKYEPHRIPQDPPAEGAVAVMMVAAPQPAVEPEPPEIEVIRETEPETVGTRPWLVPTVVGIASALGGALAGGLLF